MKKADDGQFTDINFLELFKKSLALSFTVFLFGMNQSYAANNITPGGNYGTNVEGGNTNNTTITGGIINNGTGFNHFDQFQVGNGGTANLIFGEGADRYVNMVNNQVSIYGIFNSIKGGEIGGNVIFVSPMGMIVGSTGIMNVGSLQTITPSLLDYNRVMGTTNFSDISALTSNSTTSTTRIDGKIFAIDSVNISDGRSVTIHKNADIVSGFNQDGFAKTKLHGFKMSEIVNSDGIVDAAYMSGNSGSIKIVSTNINTSGVSDGTAHIIQSSGDITLDTPKVGDIGVITTGSKIYAQGNVSIGNDAAQSGTGTVLIENTVTAQGDVNLKAMANIAQEANVTAGKNINVKADIYNQNKNTTTTSLNGGTINIDGAASLGKIVNKSGNIDIKAATNTDLLFQDTVSAENGDINVSSTSGNILQSDDTFDALQTKNGGKLSIRTYGPSKSIGSQSQSLNLDVDGAVDISSVRGISHLKSTKSTLTLGNISGVSSLDAKSLKDIKIKDNIEVGGNIKLTADEGINQQAGSIVSNGTGDINITNGSKGAITVGNITNYDGAIAIENKALGEKLTISQLLEATGNIDITSNAGIEQTDASLISSTGGGNINLTNKTAGDLTVGSLNSASGDINISNSASDGIVSLQKNISATKNLNISSKGGITQNAGTSLTVNGTNSSHINISNVGKGDVSLKNITNSNGNILIKNTLDAKTDPSLAGSVNLDGDILAGNGFIDISSGNNLTQNGTITANGKNAQNQSVKITTLNNASLDRITGKNDLTINSGSTVLNGLVQSTEGNINLASQSDITQSISGKTLDAKGNIIITSTTGDIGKIGTELLPGQSIMLNSDGIVTLTGKDINVTSPDKNVTFGKVTGTNDIKLATTFSTVPVPGGKLTLNDTVSGKKISINSVKDIDIKGNLTSAGGLEITAKEGILQNASSVLTNNTSGNIKLTNTDSGNISTSVITNKNGNIEVKNTATGADSGKINLNGLYTATSGGVTISAQSDIVQNNALVKAIISSGNVSLESIEGSIGTDTRFITMETPGSVSAKAPVGSVYLKAIGSDLKLTDDSEIVFGKDIGLASDKTVIIEKTGGITANDGSIYIDSNGLFTLDKDLTAKNYISIKGANGIDLRSNSTLTTTGTGEGIGNVSIVNAGAAARQGKGVVNINNINSTGKITIKSDNIITDTNNLKINNNANILAAKGIDINSNTGINQGSGSSITNTDSGNINITNSLQNDTNLGKINNKNGNINITSNPNSGSVKLNDEINSENGDVTIKSNTYILQNAAAAIIKAGKNINLTSNFDIGATGANGSVKVNSDGIVNASGRGIFLESPDKDINTGLVTATDDVNIKTTTSGSIIAKDKIAGQNVVLNAIDSILQDENLALAIDAAKNITLTAQNGNIGSSSGTGGNPNRLDVASLGIVTASAARGEVNINSVNKNITFGNVTSGGDVNLSSTGANGQITTNSTLNAGSGSINIDSSKNVVMNNQVSASNDVNIKAQTGIKQSAGEIKSQTGNINLTNSVSGDITLKNVTASDGNIVISGENSTGDVSLTGTLSANSLADPTKGQVSIKAGRHLTQTGTGVSIDAKNSIDLSSKTGSIGKSDTENIKINIQDPNGLLSANAQNGAIYAETKNNDLNLGTISAKDNVSLKTTGTTGNINIKDTVHGGNVSLNSVGNIAQTSATTSLFSGGTIYLKAAGNVGGTGADTIKVSAVGNVSGDAQNYYIESLEGDLKTGVITASNDLEMTASKAGSSVILNGLAKANKVKITADQNIRQNSALAKAIESTTDISLTATNGDIGEAKTSTTPANAIDLSAGGSITASAAQGSVVINGVASNIQTDNITAKNNIDLTTTTSGKITVTNDLITNTGYIRLDSAEDLLISNNIKATGDVILGAANGIIQNGGDIASTGAGNIVVTNKNLNDISLKKLTTNDGNITITNDALNSNIIFGDVITSGGTGKITVGSKGNIEQTSSTVSLVSNSDITLNALGNVGKLNGVNVESIKVATDGNVIGSGKKFYIESVGKNLNTGDINASQDVILKASDSGNSVNLNGLVKGSDVTVIADQNIYQNAALTKAIESQSDVILVAQNGDIGQSGNAIDLSAGGSITASAAQGSVVINGVESDIQTDNITAKNNIDLTTTSSGKITVSNDLITNTGYIRLNSAEDLVISNDINANGNVILIANKGISQTDGLIQSSGLGKVLIQNYNDGNISLKDVTSNSGGIDIINSSANGGNVIFNTTVTTTNGGDIYVEAHKDIIQGFVGDAIASGAEIRLVSVSGDIGKAGNSINVKVLPTKTVNASAAAGSVNINSTAQDVQFGNVQAGKDINLSTTNSGKLSLTNDLTTSGGNINLDSAQDLEINKNVTASGDVKLNASGGILQTDGNVASTGTGSITVTNNTTGNISLKKVNANSGNIDITNNAENSDIVLNDEIKTNNGANITVTSKGNISHTGENAVLNSDGNINLSAQKDIGLLGKFLKVFTRNDGKVNAQAQNIYLESTDNNLNTGSLAALNNVELKTTGTTGSVIAKGNITAQNDIKINSVENISTQGALDAKDITLNATNNITSTSNITGNNVGFTAGNNISSNSEITAQSVNFNAGNDIVSDSQIIADNIVMSAIENITESGTLTALTGDVTLTTTNGNISTNKIISANDATLNSGANLTVNEITAGKDISLTSKGDTLANGELSAETIQIEATGNIVSNIINALKNVILKSDGDITANDTITGETVALTSKKNITTKKLVSGKDVSFDATENITSENVSSTNDATFTAGGNINSNTINSNNNVSFTSGGNITSGKTTANKIDFISGGDIVSGLTTSNTAVIFDAGGNITANENLSGTTISLTADKNITTKKLVSGESVTITALEDVSSKDITALEGISISGKNISSDGTLSAKDVQVNATGNIVSNIIDAVNNVSLTAGGNIVSGKTTAVNNVLFSGNDIKTDGDIGAKTIRLDARGNIIANKNLNAKNNIDLTAGKGITQNAASVFKIDENGHITITANDGNIDLAGAIKNQNGNVNIENNSTGNHSLSVNDLETNGAFSITNNANGLLNLTGIINNASQNATITANNTGSESGIVTTGKINNKGTIQIENKGQKGTKLGGIINNNLVEGDAANPSKISVNNINGSLDITGDIKNGINKDSQNEVYLANSGSGGLNFTSSGVIDNHGILNLENTSGNMSLWGTLKARLKSKNNFKNTGITGSADDDVIVGLKLENWGNEITYENTGAGSLIVHEDAVLSNFSVKDDEGVHTGILNLKNSGTDGLAGGGIEINGTINNGLISDGTIIGNDNQIIAAGEVVHGGIVNIENSGTGVSVDTENNPSQRTDDFGIEINSTAKINNYAELNIKNSNPNAVGKIKIDGKISGDKGTILTGTPAGTAPIPSGNVINIENKAQGAQSGIVFTKDSVTDVKGNTLNINNDGESGVIFEKDSSVVSSTDINLLNNQGGVSLAGKLHGKNVSIKNKDSNVTIAHNTNSGNVSADNDIKIEVTNGDIVNAATADSLADGIGIKAGNNISLSAKNIGMLDTTLNDIINNGFNLDPNNSIHLSSGGKVNANAQNNLNLKSINENLNIEDLNAQNAILSSLNGNINADKLTTNNLYLHAQGDTAEINVNNLTNSGKLYSESGANTNIESLGALNIETMYSKNGSINIDSQGNTYIKEISAPKDITIKVHDEKLSIETLGRVKRAAATAPETVNLTVLDSKRVPTTPPQAGMNPDELENVTPNGKLDIMHAYVKNKVTLKADTITAQAYDLSDTAQSGDKRIDSDGNAATGFHNANTEGKLLEFDIQGANYAQGDVSGDSYNPAYKPDADDKKALNVHLTIGDPVGDALYGAYFKKLYADYAFIDSVSVADPSAFSHIKIESGIFGEKAIIRNGKYRVDVDNNEIVYDYPINKHYDDEPDKIINNKGSINMDIFDSIVIVKPLDPSDLPQNYNPNRQVKDPNLEEKTKQISTKKKDNRAIKAEQSTGFREINWVVRNSENEIIGSSDKVQNASVQRLLSLTEKGMVFAVNNEIKAKDTLQISLSYKDIPFNVKAKVVDVNKGEAFVEFENVDKLTETIMKYAGMYQENL